MTHALQQSLGPASLDDQELSTIAKILYDQAGIVIAPGKGSMVQSRLGKRLRALGLKDYRSYIDLITSDAGGDEKREMISALTTNVTQFFRENHHFETLRSKALPELLERARAGGKVRIWSAGSSNGQEAFSIALVLADMAPDLARLNIKILATDIDTQMIARGREALYDASALNSIPTALHRFVSVGPEGLRMSEPLRALISFHELNLHNPWPMKGPFDIIFCRNVVIYFDPSAQKRLWNRFESVLSPGGWLFVGHSERVPLEPPCKLSAAGITTYRSPTIPKPTGGTTWH